MSLKLIAPLTGIIGTIASVVGVSTSNSRPEKAANPTPSHLWKVEKVGTVSLETKCTLSENSEASRGEYLLKLNLDLDRRSLDDILRKREHTINSDVEFKALSDWNQIQELTKNGGLGTRMKVQIEREKGQIRVVFETKVETLGSGGAKKWQEMKTFVYSNSGIRPV